MGKPFRKGMRLGKIVRCLCRRILEPACRQPPAAVSGGLAPAARKRCHGRSAIVYPYTLGRAGLDQSLRRWLWPPPPILAVKNAGQPDRRQTCPTRRPWPRTAGCGLALHLLPAHSGGNTARVRCARTETAACNHSWTGSLRCTQCKATNRHATASVGRVTGVVSAWGRTHDCAPRRNPRSYTHSHTAPGRTPAGRSDHCGHTRRP